MLSFCLCLASRQIKNQKQPYECKHSTAVSGFILLKIDYYILKYCMLCANSSAIFFSCPALSYTCLKVSRTSCVSA